jgi:pimeloyl-ACP methyl ester carboxylesterase
MSYAWELQESGPADAARSVLLLPGGLNRARSYAELMAQPALAGVRLIAATLPGHCGTAAPGDFSIGTAARWAGDLADERGCDVVVGFSMGANVAVEMVATGAFSGPAVLLGIALSARDEPLFFRAICRLGDVLGGLPAATLLKMMGPVTKKVRVPAERQAEILSDLRSNDPRVMRKIFRDYLNYLHQQDDPAERLCRAEVPVWVVHSVKGDGGLTDDERRILGACPNTTVVTIPGATFFLPSEEPARIAEVVVQALARVG